ncbi:centromere protein X isoform 5-T5 [Lycaon pictus]
MAKAAGLECLRPGAGAQDHPGSRGLEPRQQQELVSKLLQMHFTDSKTKVGGDALRLMAELLTIFVVEAAIRSVRQAQAEDLALVDVDQLEKVLPQLQVRRSSGPDTPTSELPCNLLTTRCPSEDASLNYVFALPRQHQ